MRAGVLAAVAVVVTAGPAEAKRPALANRCLALAGEPFSFKPTVAGRFMLHDRDGRLLTATGERLTRDGAPGPSTEWLVEPARGGRYTLRSEQTGRALTRVKLVRARGCRRFPEAALGLRGRPARSLNRDGTVFGWADAHLHVTADLRAGGRVVSGTAFDRYGITRALGADAEVHGADGSQDLTGNLLRDGNPAGTHDTAGWPGFTGWPTHDTYTHQQVYHRWLERAWRAGLRVVTAQIVEDETLCELQPQRSHSCDETETVVLGVERLRALEAYVDAQSGGRGRGWFRLVDDPRAARRVIRQGKLAVLIGVESSSPFGCSEFLGAPRCDQAAVDRGIALYRSLGISSLFVAHWVDNAFAGASVEEGDIGTFIATFQLETTGHPYSTGPCPDPAYGSSCNTKGLTDLGRHLIDRLMDAGMLIEVDHLSERARHDVMAIAERRRYPLVSSHTGSGGIWTESDLRRLYAIGGFATARPDTAGRLASTILRFKPYARPGEVFGVGLGSDTGGFAAAPGPDPEAAQDPLRYPARPYGSTSKLLCQVSGTRTFDLNRDGVAHYGMYPDLLAYMRQKPQGEEATRVLYRSAEAYLRTWERAHRVG